LTEAQKNESLNVIFNQIYRGFRPQSVTMQKKPNSQEDLSRAAYQGLRRMLYNKELVPGQKIAYRELAERLKMSPTPIIQALKWLELQGFVRHEANRGYSMAPFSMKEIEEIYELRELLEPSLVDATVQRLDKEGVGLLRAALEAHRSAQREFYLKERLFKNREFHVTLAALSGKETQIRILQNLFDMLFLKYGGNYLPTSSLKSVDEEHQAIYDSVVLRDVERARALLAGHVSSVKKQVLASVGQMLAEQEKSEF
jgi:DNA-binding GntR family transcriptional regulator